MAEHNRHMKTAQQLRLLSDALDSGRLGPVRRLVNILSPAEIGNLLESLPAAKRNIVWGLVDPEDDGEVLVHVGEDVRESLLADMDQDEIIAAVEDLDLDDLADLIDDLPDTVIDEVLKSMDREHRERLEQALSYPEDSAGRLMNTDVVTVRADVTIDVVLRYLRLRGEMPEHTDYLYVVSRRNQYLGRISVSDLLTKDPVTPINELIDDDQPGIPLETPDNEVATQFSDHDWISAPVVDANNILLGRITIDDVVDIIRGQAEHQALSAVGLDEDEDLFSPVPRAAKRRALWLGINLATAFLASWVIGRFEAHPAADRTAGHPDADRGQHGRRGRYPNLDADGARHRARPGRRRQPESAVQQGSPGRPDQRPGLGGGGRHHRRLLVRAENRPGDRLRHGHQSGHRGDVRRASCRCC